MSRWRYLLCAQPNPYPIGDRPVKKGNGMALGVVLETGNHHFPSGITGPAVRLPLAEDSKRQEGYAVEVLDGNCEARSTPGAMH
jgi:hypothetical protein